MAFLHSIIRKFTKEVSIIYAHPKFVRKIHRTPETIKTIGLWQSGVANISY